MVIVTVERRKRKGLRIAQRDRVGRNDSDQGKGGARTRICGGKEDGEGAETIWLRLLVASGGRKGLRLS
ncbi:hypothetical protein AMTR_s00034p00064480 [Amborella trichopoda]|uniref:Uncharacterized protein n=1 Tax=Amborella trichopoda TaxID=13333 RepID=W1PXM2_AMBTC|nr:hypothetical protein AMTR_s00034p00064480 [Amborella trichopoda]